MSGSAATNWDDAFKQAGSVYNVDPTLLKALQSVENAPGDPNAISKAGAKGLMQIMPATGASVGMTDLTDPQQSIFGAAAILRKNLDLFNGNVPKAVAAYNAGPSGNFSNPQTEAYVPKVAAAYQRFAQANSNTATDATYAPADPAPSAAAAAPDPDAGRLAALNAQWGVGGTTSAPATSAAPAPATLPIDPDAARLSALNAQWGVTSQPRPVIAAAPSGPLDPGDLPAPAAGQPAPPPVVPSAMDNLSVGLRQGFITAPAQLAGRVQTAAMDVDRAIPALGSIDAYAGYTPQSVTASNNALAQQAAQYSAGAGQTGMGQVGNMLGGAAIAAPFYMAGGAALGGAARAGAAGVSGLPYIGRTANALAPLVAGTGGSTLAGKIAAGGVSGAVQGGIAGGGMALATGGNALSGAASGAMSGVAGGAAGGALGYVGGKVASGLGLDVGNALASPKAGSSAPPVSSVMASLPKPPPDIATNPAAMNSHADDVIAQFAGGSDPVPTYQSPIPGVQVTAGTATANPGVASLELTLSKHPILGAPLKVQQAANNTARVNYLSDIVGTPEAAAAAEDARDNVTGAMRDASLAGASPADTQNTLSTLDGIVASPAGQDDQVVRAMNNIRGKLVTGTDDNGNEILQSDPAQLYGIRKAINNLMQPQQVNSDAAPNATAQLMTLRNSLDADMAPTTPGFDDYLKTYSQMSQPINAAYSLQRIFNNRIAAGDTTPLRLGEVNGALARIQLAAQNPINGAASISPDQMTGLTNLQTDLAAEAQPLNAAIGPGSSTFGHFLTNSVKQQAASKVGGVMSDVAIPAAGAAAEHLLTGSGGGLGFTAGLGADILRHQYAARAVVKAGTAAAQAQQTSDALDATIASKLFNPSTLRGAAPPVVPNALATPSGVAAPSGGVP